MTTAEEFFWAHVKKTPRCWLWTGSRNGRGYGQFGYQRRHHMAHRFAYEFLIGPIPEGLQIDHLCRVRECVNPAHLEPVTASENTRRGLNPKLAALLSSSKRECPSGHPYAGANLVIDERGRRRCRTCMREASRRYRRRRGGPRVG